MAMTDERRRRERAARRSAARPSTRPSSAIEKQFGRGAIMKLGSAERQAVDFDPDGLHRAGPGARRRRHPARPDHRDLRPGVVGQDDALPARPRRGPARGGVVAFIDVEHALDPGYARACGVNVDELLVSPAGHRRAGPRDHRDPDPLRRHRLRRRRLRRRARAARRDRGRDGRLVRRHPGPAHEPGAAQADGRRLALEHGARSSPTSCARRSGSCSATRRRRRAAAR